MTSRPAMTTPHSDDARRLKALHGLLLSEEIEVDFQAELKRFADLAAVAFKMPVTMVSALEESTLRVLGSHGITATELPAEHSFCRTAVLNNEALLIPDTLAEPCWADNPNVTGSLGLRFYAGVPLRADDGVAVGTLCLLDTKTRPDFSDGSMRLLQQWGQMIGRELHLRVRRRALLIERELFAQGPLAAVLWEPEKRHLTFHSANLSEAIGQSAAAELARGIPFEQIIHIADRHDFRAVMRSHVEHPVRRVELSYRLTPDRGPERWVRQISWGEPRLRDGELQIRGYLFDETRSKQLESRTAAARERLMLAVESAQLGTFELDLVNQQRVMNPRAAEMIGFRPEETDTHFDFWTSRIHPTDLADVEVQIERHKLGGLRAGLNSMEYRVRHRDGHYIWVQSFSRVSQMSPAGEHLRVVGTLLDITQRKREELTRNRQRGLLDVLNQAQSSFLLTRNMYEAFNSLFQPLLKLTDSRFGFIGIVGRDPDGRQYLDLPATSDLSWNERTRQMYAEMADGRKSMRFYDLDNLFGYVVTHGQVVCTNDPGSHRASKGVPTGHPPLENFLGMPINFNGQVTGMIGLANAPEGYDADLVAALQPLSVALAALIHARELESQRQQAAAELERLATTDELTGLVNRRYFFEQARAALSRADRDKLPLTLALLDLDHFKQVNDRYGHAGGDAVLRHFAVLASAALRSTDVLARIGGEEFAVLMHDTDGPGAAVVLERVRAAVEQTVMPFEGQDLTVRLSGGWAVVGPSCQRIEELLAQADAALYRAKTEGRNRVLSAHV